MWGVVLGLFLVSAILIGGDVKVSHQTPKNMFGNKKKVIKTTPEEIKSFYENRFKQKKQEKLNDRSK